MTISKSTSQLAIRTAITTALLTLAIGMTGCATTELLESGSGGSYSSRSQQVTLVDDEVVAFGKPANPVATIPADGLVIVGEKNSYVLLQGGGQVATLLTTLDPRYIKLTKDLNFYSPKNDGRFQGSLDLSYAKLKSTFTSADYDFVLRNQGTDCTTDSDTRLNAQRFCFSVPLQGGVYPAVSNLSLIQSKFKTLSHPYQVSIYTNQTVTNTSSSSGGNGASALGKLVLLPFALAFDVVTLPVQVLAAVD